ncbi:unnamed protein product [Phaedon cochleariae]|uniref:Phospholipid/glycerol acyltransferase domain-containing protein n=1 Tax=Phaedon cochleariae TaxID=80249 RepID=A0A9N9SLB0_PHACE|nr:unnamed protein product [Phaedon cochleariae]
MICSLVFVNVAVCVLVGFTRFDLFDTIYGSLQLFLVLQFTYVVLLLQGVNKMVDIISNRVFDTYNRFSPSNNHQNESLSTLRTLNRFVRDEKFKRTQARVADTQAREAQLFDIKENIPDVQLAHRRSFMGLSCQNCTMTSRESLVTKATETLALRNILDYRLPFSKNGFFQRSFAHLYQVCELKKFPYAQVADVTLRDERLKRAVETATAQQFRDTENGSEEFYQELLMSNQRRSKKLLIDMRSTLSDFLLRFTSWVLYKLLPCFLTSVVVHPGQVEMLKEAGKSSLPLIFLPLHRSHLDYILISFILLNNNVRSPLVAAGDNLRIPFFGSLLRGLGAFFIKRRIDPVMGRKDVVYKTVLHAYMNNCLRAGHNLEFFLEGGRTRTGKPCMPKYGVLSVLVDSFLDGSIEDALLVPVSVNYEKLVDGNFVREQLGQPKEMETFGNAVKGIWKVLNSNYGMMRIDFNQPFSLRELVKTFNMNSNMVAPLNGHKMLKSNPSVNSLYGTDVVSEEQRGLVAQISKHIIYDCAQSTSVMSTNALAYLLLTKFRDGANIEELVDALDALRKDLEYARRDIGFSGDSIDVITYAMEMLGPALVRKEKPHNTADSDVIKPVTLLPNVIELAYYSNTLVTHFALDSLVAIAAQAIDPHAQAIDPHAQAIDAHAQAIDAHAQAIDAQVTHPSSEVGHRELVEATLELCDIVQYEFLLCKPCQSLEQVVTSCVDELVYRKQIFLVDTEEETELSRRSRRIAKQFDDNDNDYDEGPRKVYRRNQDPAAVDTLRCLRAPLMPLIECYATTAFALDKLVGRQLLEEELVRETLNELKERLAQGTLEYAESVSVDSIKNALKLYQHWGILECHSEKKLRLYYLRENQDDSESVKALYQRVNKYRRSK